MSPRLPRAITVNGKLEPCPFCGARGTAETWPEGPTPTAARIVCKSPCCDMQPVAAGANLRIAIAKWNRRDGGAPSDALPLALVAKLGSIVVHASEYWSATSHHFDRAALLALLEDAEVQQWLTDNAALLPVKR